MDEYFESIRSKFDKLNRGVDRASRIALYGLILFLVGAGLVILGVSALNSEFVRVIVVAILKPLGLQSPTEVTRYWFVPGAALASLGLALVVGGAARETKHRSKFSPLQIAFAYSYLISSELKKYQTNEDPTHLKYALALWPQFKSSLRPVLSPNSSYYTYISGPHGPIEPVMPSELREYLWPELRLLKGKLVWFRLEENTERIICALEDLQSKVYQRIVHRLEIRQAYECMRDLGTYFYHSILQRSSKIDSKAQAMELAHSLECLLRLAERIEALPALGSAHPEPQTKISRRLLSHLGAIQGAFVHQNVLVRFIAWYAFILVLCLLATRFTFYIFPHMEMGKEIAVALISTPLACAAAAVAVTRGPLKDKGAS